jgi:hypothetical protein
VKPSGTGPGAPPESAARREGWFVRRMLPRSCTERPGREAFPMSEFPRCALCGAPPCCLDCGETAEDDAEIGDPCASCGESLRAPDIFCTHQRECQSYSFASEPPKFRWTVESFLSITLVSKSE